MTHSSPGQPRVVDHMSQPPIISGFSDSLDDAMLQELDQHFPSGQQELKQPAQATVEESVHEKRDEIHKDAVESSVSEDNMLLERPCILQKVPTEDRGYRYGPAVQLAPDQFTKRPIKPVPLHQDDLPQQIRNRLSPLPGQGNHSAGHSFPVLGGVHLEKPVTNMFPLNESPGRTRGQPGETPDKKTDDAKTRGSAVAGAKQTQDTRAKPPFPNSSPTESLRSYRRSQVVEDIAQSPTFPSGEQPRRQPFLARPTNPDTPAQGQDHALPERGELGHIPALHHQLPKPGPQTQPRKIEYREGDSTRHRHHKSLRGDHHPSMAGSAARVRHQPVNRPLKEIAPIKSTMPTERLRPGSRSSNVSKQRSVIT